MTKKIKKDKEETKIVLRLIKSMKTIKAGLISGATLSASGILLSMITPLLLGEFIDIINNYQIAKNAGLAAVLDFSGAIEKLVYLLVIYALVGLLSSLKMYLMNNVVSKHFTCAYRIKMSDKIKRLPVSYIDKTTNGDVISRMTYDVSVMGNTVHTITDTLVSGFLQLFAIAAIMYIINWQLATLVIAFVPLSVIISLKAAGSSEKYFTTVQDEFGKMYSHIEESYSGFTTMKAYNLENMLIGQHSIINNKINSSEQKGNFLSNSVQPIISLTNSIAYAIICLMGGYFAIKGSLGVGGVVAVILYAKQFSSPLDNIANSLSMLQRSKASSKRVYEMLDKEEMVESDNGSVISGKGNIIFDNVDFSYDKDRPLITNLNLDIKSGQKVAIVGPTGAGKTTLVNLLMRFYDIQKGTITVDGVDIMSIPRSKLRDVFSMVLQDTWLFGGTIYDNISYGKEGSTKEEIEKVCEAAYCDHFINTLPNGYETVIDENCSNISGGQRQLLTIARAFLSDRAVLILDEATSNVDTRTEIYIQMAMDELMKNRTSFVIAHRLSTIINADIILVINEGNVVETGTHKELLEKKGFYYELYMSQYSLREKKKVA